MKFKWRLWSRQTFASVVLAWIVLSYVFMWPPIVQNRKDLIWGLPVPRTTSGTIPCRNNLRQIDGAISTWGYENHKTNGTPVTFDDIKPYLKLNSKGEIPSCPDGGKYILYAVGAIPQVICSWGTNTDMTRVRVHYIFWEWATPRTNEHRLP
jgi:hypothetical protein